MSNTFVRRKPERLSVEKRTDFLPEDPELATNTLPRCLMLLPEFPPKNTAGVHRSLRFCQFLPEFGWQPMVLASNVSEPGGEKLLAKVPPGMVVRRVGPVVNAATSPAVSGSLVAKRSAIYALLRSLLRPAMQLATETPDRQIGWSRLAGREGRAYLRNHSVDALYSSGPPHSIHLAARRLSRAFGLPWVADLRDPWARKPWTKKQNPWGQRLLPFFERTVIRDATKVVLNTHASYQDFCAAYPQHAQKFHCIPNGLDPELVEKVREIGNVRTNDNSVPVLCHPGSMYGHRDPAPVLRAIARLHVQGLSIKLQQIGPIADAFQPRALADKLGIAQLFEHIPSLAHGETLLAMARADLLLIIQPDAPLMVPSKAYEMLAFEQPVVAVCDSAGTEAVVREAGGFTAPSRDELQIARVLREAWEGRCDSDRRRLRAGARQKYDGKKLTENLADLLDQALHGSRAPRLAPASEIG